MRNEAFKVHFIFGMTFDCPICFQSLRILPILTFSYYSCLIIVKRGDRIAQLIIEVIAHPEIEEVMDLDDVRDRPDNTNFFLKDKWAHQTNPDAIFGNHTD